VNGSDSNLNRCVPKPMLTAIYFRLPRHQPPNKGKAEFDDDPGRKQVWEADRY